MLGLRSALLPLLVGAGLFVTSASADTLYANFFSTGFGTLDTATGVFTQLGTSPSIFGMGFAPDGTLYGTDGATPVGVDKIDSSGNLTGVGSVLSNSANGSTLGSDGLIYAVSVDSSTIFYTIDPTSPTLAVNVISSGLGFANDGMAVFANGFFYTDTFGSGANDVLERVDPVTGVATAVGTGMGTQIFAAANVNGTIYGGASDGNLYTIDLSTGLASLDAAITGTGSTGFVAALASVPEPSTTMLAGAGIALIGLVFTVRRRRTESSSS